MTNSVPCQAPDQKFYDVAIQQVRYEGHLLWQRFGAFLLPHTVFLAVVLNFAADRQLPSYSLGVFLLSLVGLLLCVPWLAVYVRSSAYYTFRIIQASAVEPTGWQLLGGKAQDFSVGRPVNIGEETQRMPWLARKLRTGGASRMMILLFFLIYFVLVIISGPWCLD